MTTFIIATNNSHKLFELERILEPLGIHAVTAKQAGIDLGDVEETGETFAENAYIKAHSAFEKVSGFAVVADDSGLSVDALNGRPGIYSARYAGENSTDSEKVQKLLFEMKNVEKEQRTAHFTSSICCILDNGRIIRCEGYCNGSIAFEPKGENGFGYDPVFLVDEERTFAQLSNEEKDRISHRGNALRKFRDELIKYMEENNADK